MKTQHPKVHLDSRRKRNWCGLYYDEAGKRRYVTLGARTSMKKAEAQTKLDELVAPINKARALKVLNEASTLAQYVEAAYLPYGREKWKASTALTTEQRVRHHIIGGELAALTVNELNRHNMQAFLNSRTHLSFSLINNLKWDLCAILDLAVSDGIVKLNRARKVLKTPQEAKPKIQLVMTAAQVSEALAVLDLRDRLFVRMAVYAGIRPGELVALRWTDIQDGMALVDDRVYRGVADKTKNRKVRKVALSASVQAELAQWKHFARRADSFIFASESGTPIAYANLMTRCIRPALEKIGLGWVDFRVMRRTNATLGLASGADAKVMADNRGHGLGVSMDTYTQSTDAQKAQAVEKLEGLIQ